MMTGKIFSPIRRRSSTPATETPSSSPSAGPVEAGAGSPRERHWLAVLDLVFSITGWPDAEAPDGNLDLG